MKKTAKEIELPPKTRGRLNGVGFTLSGPHVDRDGAGSPIPYGLEGKKALWKYTVRVPIGSERKCRNLAALDDSDALMRAPAVAADLRTEAAAKAMAAHEEAKAIEQRTVVQLCDHMLVVKAADNSSTREGTVNGYPRDFARFIREDPLGALRVADVTPDHVDAWIARHAGAKAGASRTRSKRIKLLGSLFRLAVGDGWRGTSPVLKRHHVPVLPETAQKGKIKGDQRVARVLSTDELLAIVDKLDPEDAALRLLVTLTGRIGFRLREATHLRFGCR